VLCLYDISDTIFHSLTFGNEVKKVATANLIPVRMIFSILKTVLEVLPGGGSGRTTNSSEGWEVPDFLSYKVLPGEVLQLGKEGKCNLQQ
jgi:hypothetical protein